MIKVGTSKTRWYKNRIDSLIKVTETRYGNWSTKMTYINVSGLFMRDHVDGSLLSGKKPRYPSRGQLYEIQCPLSQHLFEIYQICIWFHLNSSYSPQQYTPALARTQICKFSALILQDRRVYLTNARMANISSLPKGCRLILFAHIRRSTAIISSRGSTTHTTTRATEALVNMICSRRSRRLQ